MKIQVISHDKTIRYGNEHEYTYSPLSEPISLDAFDLNIISLQTPELWRHSDSDKNSIDDINDFESLHCLLNSYKKTSVIICFPQNYRFYWYQNGVSYRYSILIKDMIPNLISCLSYLFPSGNSYKLVYENSTTLCGKTKFAAPFYFDHVENLTPSITKSEGSENSTTILYKHNLFFTTLDLSLPNTSINEFLKELGLIDNKSETPQWIHDYKFLDDEKQEKIVYDATEEIRKQNDYIKNANEKLEDNLRYKTILFETGSNLVNIVFDILQKILNYDLSSFVDKKQEDFKIVLPNVTFIGEIKGITSNVKNENISQLDVHCQTYIDSLDEDNKTETVKGILIITPLRNKPLNEREDIHEKQIQLAMRNGSLIITTETLLQLFMAFLNKQITTDKIIELLKTKTGLLTNNDFI